MDMSKADYQESIRRLFSAAAAGAFREAFPEQYSVVGDEQVFSDKAVMGFIEKPKDPRMGRFALPVFRFSKLLKAKPPEIAAAVVEGINAGLGDSAVCVAAGGFLNVQVNFEAEAKDTLGRVIGEGNRFGNKTVTGNRTFLVEYSSPNIAKPFGIGHLRSTILGDSLRRIFAKLGYQTVGINYPGDWGTQFGKMIVAYRNWWSDSSVTPDIKALLELYVRFHEEAETDKSLDDKAREAFKQLESGDADAVALWEKFKGISHAEFDRVYGLLGVHFDRVIGESFLNDKMEPMIQRLEAAGLTSVSEGALVVELDDPNLPPCLLKKADGATLYATRDLAGLAYRWEHYRFHESLYVVGTSQSDHFKQALMVIDKLEQAERLPEADRMTGRVKHIDFGWVKFDNRTMSTRRGDIIFLEDVIDQAVGLAREKILEKNPSLADLDQTAHQIGVGAVKFSQLSVRRQKDVNFIWEEVLNFDGETGPYLQYTHARLCSLLRHYNGTVTADVDFALLKEEEERRVVELLADFPEAVGDAAGNYDPYYIAVHLFKLTAAFNRVYQRKNEEGRIDKIISDDERLTAARIALVKAVQAVLNEGLYLLGLDAPEEM